jgi:hypothetical protein
MAPKAAGPLRSMGKLLGRSGGFGFAGGGAAAKKWSSIVPTTDGRDNPRATVRLAAGAHRIELTASSTGTAPLSIRFAWMTPELRQANLEAAVAAARAARTAVVFAWSGVGGALALPEDQDELIRRVAAANPRTVVVLNTGGPVAMPWKDEVRAILEMWYPGQEGGWATANLLLGRANPGGKLPVTFPARLEDAPARAAGHPERLAPPRSAGGGKAETPAATYSEGIAVGYRWYDRQSIQPLFPFGHGLSYTRFEYSQLAVKRRGDGVDVAVTLRNAGSRRGAEVAQAYIGPPAGGEVDFAPQVAGGFRARRDRTGTEAGRSPSTSARGRSPTGPPPAHDWVMPEGSRADLPRIVVARHQAARNHPGPGLTEMKAMAGTGARPRAPHGAPIAHAAGRHGRQGQLTTPLRTSIPLPVSRVRDTRLTAECARLRRKTMRTPNFPPVSADSFHPHQRMEK